MPAINMNRDARARLLAAREKLGVNKTEMAAWLETPHQTYANWEAGTRRTPHLAAAAAEMLVDLVERGLRKVTPIGYERKNWLAAAAKMRVADRTVDGLMARFGITRMQAHGIRSALVHRGRRVPGA